MKSIIASILLIALVWSVQAASISSDYDKYIRFHWKGGLQSHAIKMKVFPYLDELYGLNTFLVIYTKQANTPVAPIISPVQFIDVPYPAKDIFLNGLTPVTRYHYTFLFTSDRELSVDAFQSYYASTSVKEFSFNTFAFAMQPYNFTFGASSGAKTGSTSSVFQNLADENLDFFMHMGDMHNEYITQDDTTMFYDAYYKVFASPIQKNFLEATPLFYMWNDDFGIKDDNGSYPTKTAATTAYKKFVPFVKNRLPVDDSKYSTNAPAPVAETPGMYISYVADSTSGIFRSFIVGRCLFVMLVLRSFNNVTLGDILGDEQRLWLENQFRFAGYNEDIKMVFVVSSLPWITQEPGSEWETFENDQEFINNMVQTYLNPNGKKIMMVAGGAHMIAFDDGTNNKKGGFPVIQASALDDSPNVQGGPYSSGSYPGTGQYSKFEVTDSADQGVCVKIALKQLGSNVIEFNTCPQETVVLSQETESKGWIAALGVILVLGAVCLIVCLRVCKNRKSRNVRLGDQKIQNEDGMRQVQFEEYDQGHYLRE